MVWMMTGQKTQANRLASLVKRALPDEARSLVSEDDIVRDAARHLAWRSLHDFIPWATPGYDDPRHLDPLIKILEDPVGKSYREVVHAPPRHAKTDTVISGLVRLLWKNPRLEIAYVSYSSPIAAAKGRKARDLALRVGITPNKDRWSADDWYTAEGGRFYATGVTGSLIGQGFDIIVVDDPIHDRMEAESQSQRDRLWDWFWDGCMTRRKPGFSVFVMMHRWHEDDLCGRLLKEGWHEVWLPAVAEENDPNGRVAGTVLWPEMWPLEALRAMMEKRYTWRSIYQGRPTGRGTDIFSGVHTYKCLPVKYRTVIGLDLAASSTPGHDSSVMVVLSFADGLYYVRHAVKRQVRAPEFVPEIKRELARFPGAKIRWHYSGMEKAVGQFIKDKGIKLDMQPAVKSKLLRAEPAADDWNAGKIMVPEDRQANPWVEWFVEDMLNFTGVQGGRDDTADGLSSGHSKARQMMKARRRAGKVKVF